MRFEAEVIDLDKVYNAIAGLSDIEKNQVIRSGLRMAANLFVVQGKSNLRSRMKAKKGYTGNLLKAFQTKVKKNKLGALAGFNGYGAHAHLLDMGTEARYNKKGAYRGKITANNFWTDAINSNKYEVENKVMDGIERGIERIMNRRK